MSTEEFDCYDVLGVERGANDDQIKKGYRKAALRWHPDKNPDKKEEAEIMFKKVAEAYQILSDPQQRVIYDQGGLEAVRGGPSAGPSGGRGRRGGRPAGFGDMDDAFNLFQAFFGGRDPFADMGFGGDIFAEMGGGRPGRAGRSSMPARGHPFGGSPFGSMFDNDPFFSAGFGDLGGAGGGGVFVSSSSTASHSGRGGGGIVGSSTTTTTRVVNGKRVTVTEKTVRKADGTVETTRTESEGGSGAGAGGVLANSSVFASFGGGGRRNTINMVGF